MIVNKLISRSFAVGLFLTAPLAMAANQQAGTLPAHAAAELLSQLDALQSEVRDLRGQLEEQGHELSQMKAQQRDRYIDLDKRISLLMSASAARQESQASQAIASAAPAPAPVVKSEAASSLSSVQLAPIALTPVSPQARSAYDDAYGLIRSKQFETAEVAFTEFVKDYPDNTLTGNGYYWLGELKLVLGKPQEAAKSFNIVIKKFPGHSKEPDALYKLGIVNDQLGNASASKSYLQDVISRFPESKSAKLATSYLTGMK
ncbi:tol-pal system protein YbgF [Marinomonas pollencensis]|uniref:Cell division coordinator CpoB n=1 Tax=Marinomonas pollencensis TaxID=491954 RepID=A0A3E0DR98_9GAMM|nr:tol-pal system protein YbgF [Marinomonas pollencensis]REG85534.1 tol-pal system protein YbgF [Marinomonas pollencensis]